MFLNAEADDMVATSSLDWVILATDFTPYKLVRYSRLRKGSSLASSSGSLVETLSAASIAQNV